MRYELQEPHQDTTFRARVNFIVITVRVQRGFWQVRWVDVPLWLQAGGRQRAWRKGRWVSAVAAAAVAAVAAERRWWWWRMWGGSPAGSEDRAFVSVGAASPGAKGGLKDAP